MQERPEVPACHSSPTQISYVLDFYLGMFTTLGQQNLHLLVPEPRAFIQKPPWLQITTATHFHDLFTYDSPLERNVYQLKQSSVTSCYPRTKHGSRPFDTFSEKISKIARKFFCTTLITDVIGRVVRCEDDVAG